MASGGAIEGVKVLDFSRILAGPFATQILADLGAEVVKVESPGAGDESRGYGSAAKDGTVSAGGGAPNPVFVSFNRRKRSIQLDLRVPRGKQVARDLAQWADVLVHNFRPGVMERLGLGYDDLSALNPGLVYCAISGFGSTGPLAKKAGNDLISQAYSGLVSFTGEPGQNPVRCPVSIGDLSSGLYGAIGVLGALHYRQVTSKGQLVETNLLESLLSLESFHITQYFETGFVPGPMGSKNMMGQPNQVFRVRDGWVAISAVNDGMWERFCKGIGAERLLEDPRFAGLASRYRYREQLMAEIEEFLADMSVSECIAGMESFGVVCAPVNKLDEVAESPQVRSLGTIIPVEYDRHESSVPGSPLHFSLAPARREGVAPVLGASSEDILAMLGYCTSDITDLVADSVVGTTESPLRR